MDKPAIEVGGHSLLSRAVAAVADADEIVVVGPQRPLDREVRWTREDPPGTGPLAALAAGLAALGPAEEVAVLAADLPGITHDTVHRLRAALAGQPAKRQAAGQPPPGGGVPGEAAAAAREVGGGRVAGAILVDSGGHRQWLLGVWRRDALQAVLPADPANQPLGRTLGTLPLAEVPAEHGEADDVDTQADLDALDN
jgi:molybdenum cofactor guanylyltransferase